MDKLDENRRYKWSTSATNLLVSIWSHEMVQNRLKLSSRNQPVWESIARYMSGKGFTVTGMQCRTRIKNMLCSYYEAVRKKDHSFIDPYFDLFKKVVSNRDPKKKGLGRKPQKQRRNSEEIDGNLDGSSDASVEPEEPAGTQSTSDPTDNVEYLDVGNQEVQVKTHLTDREMLSNIERIVTKAIDTQTKVISDAMKLQSELVEKLLASEREKLNALLLVEQESRRQLEVRLDRLLARLETSTIPQLTYVGPIIQS